MSRWRIPLCLVWTAGLAAASQGAAVWAQPAAVPVQSPATGVLLDPGRLALARQIIAVLFPIESQEASVQSLVKAILAQYRAGMARTQHFDDPGLKKILDDALASIPDRLKPAMRVFLPNMREAMAHAYTREFSQAELGDILAFARTASGRHYLQRSTALAGDVDVAAANTAYFRQVQAVSAQIRASLTRDLTAYAQQHADTVEPTGGGGATAN